MAAELRKEGKNDDQPVPSLKPEHICRSDVDKSTLKLKKVSLTAIGFIIYSIVWVLFFIGIFQLIFS